MWEFYLPVSSLSRRELWTLAAENGVKIATATRGKKLYAVVAGSPDQVGDLYASLQKSYRASRLNTYRGLMPDFDAELMDVDREFTIESVNILKNIAETAERLSDSAKDVADRSELISKHLGKVVRKLRENP